jgi:hypothetical protein
MKQSSFSDAPSSKLLASNHPVLEKNVGCLVYSAVMAKRTGEQSVMVDSISGVKVSTSF